MTGTLAAADLSLLDARLRATVHVVHAVVTLSGLEIALSFSGVQACYSYATALLLGRDYAGRLRRCEHCARYFIAADARQVYCSPAHANAARQKRHRLRG